MIAHIRNREHIGQRTRHARPGGKHSKPLCGAEPGPDDYSKSEARRIVESAKARPDWLADVCADCLGRLS